MKMISIVLISLLTFSISGSQAVLATDTDHDGINDAHDLCPDTAQLKKLSRNFKFASAVNPDRLNPHAQAYPVDTNGCEPDTDGDGVVNSQDYCPYDSVQTLAMGIAANGCPKQSDGDGTPDYRDNCPNTPRGVKTDRYGCEIKT